MPGPAKSKLAAALTATAGLSTAAPGTSVDGSASDGSASIEMASNTPDANAEKDKQALTDAVALYNRLHSKNKQNNLNGYDAGYAEPVKQRDGNITFKFPSEAESVKFFGVFLKENPMEKFTLYDKDKKIVAFSIGDGHLYRPPKPEGDEKPSNSQKIHEGDSTFGKAQPKEEERSSHSP